MRKSILIPVVLLFAAPAVMAAEQCMAVSEYAFQITPKQVIAINDSGAPGTVILSDGKLFVQNEWVKLSADDVKRVREMERQLRVLEPRIQAENEHMANSFEGKITPADWQALQRKQESDRKDRRVRIGPVGTWQSGVGEQIFSNSAGQLIDTMIVVMRDMSGLLAGKNDPAAEQRVADAMERLPLPSASAGMFSKLCSEYAALNEIDNAVTYRYNGQPLELLRNMVPSMR